MFVDVVARAVAALKEGQLVGLPTETVYGLAADATNELAVRRIFAAKGRPTSHPLIVHVADAADARRWARAWPDDAERLAAAAWPGPLTLIVPKAAFVSDVVTAGQPTVALRVPDHPLALAVLRGLGTGVAAPSANRFGRVSPTTAQAVRDELGSAVAVVVDGGPCSVGVESTIVDLSGDAPRVLRQGGVPLERVEAILGRRVPVAGAEAGVRAPGLLASHYAPAAGVVLCTASALAAEVHQRGGQRVAVLATDAQLAAVAGAAQLIPLPMPSDAAGFARELYAALRRADALGAELILAVPPAAVGLGAAVWDRLAKAAAPRPPA